MLDDRRLADALIDVSEIEQDAIAHWQDTDDRDLVEKDRALIVKRHATALRKSIETWMGTRAMRAAVRA